MPVSTDRCSICRQDLGYTIPRCRLCRKSVCNSCAVRMGGSVFCGRGCAHAFLFGGQEEIEERAGGEEE